MLLIAAALLTGLPLQDEALPPRSPDSPFTAGVAGARSTRVPYRLLAPKTLEDGRRYPLILFLHGAGERGADNEIQLAHFPERMLEGDRRSAFPCFVLAPQCPAGDRWTTDEWGSKDSRALPPEPTEPLQAAVAALLDVCREHPVDRDRVYLTGLSMGGYGAFELAMRHPDWFAAVAPVCGGGDDEQAARLAGLPLSVWHGDADRAVPVENSRNLVAALRALGEEPLYHELAGVGHDAWTSAYGPDGCLGWLFAQRRSPEARYSAATRMLASALRKDERVAFLGDSITQSGAAPGGYVHRLTETLAASRPDVTILPAGISGHKVPDLLAREERDVRSKQPTVVFTYIGINDVWHSTSGGGTPIDAYENGLAELVRRFRGLPDARLVLATPSVIGERRRGTNALDGMLEEYAAASRRVAASVDSLCDLREAFCEHLRLFDASGEDRGVLTYDGVHLSDAGNLFVATEAALAIRRAVLHGSARKADAGSR